MKKISLIVLFFPFWVHAQQNDTIRLEECFQMAVSTHPLFGQIQLDQNISDAKKSNISKAWLPGITLEGQANYQSDVIEIDFGNFVPNQSFSFSSPHDQYKIYLNLEQKIYDGGMIKQQKALENSNLLISRQQVEIDFHQAKKQVSGVYFSVLSLSKNLELTELMLGELNNRYKSVEVAINSGAALISSGQVLKAEILKTEQQIDEIKNRRNAQIDILNRLTGLTLNENTVFEWPLEMIPPDTIEPRPEITLFELQKNMADYSLNLEKSITRPKLFAFSQAGYGRPGLNMLNTEFDDYYLVGIGLKWKILDWGELNSKKKITGYQKNKIDLQIENFNRNISVALENEQANIDNYRKAIEKDNDIIELRREIVKTALAQFENGTITATQYLTEVNAELQAKIQLETHRILLAQSFINYMLIKGDI